MYSKFYLLGNLCHPYLSLSFIDTLSQPCVRGYMIGATNMLFKQKKGVSEVIVDIGMYLGSLKNMEP